MEALFSEALSANSQDGKRINQGFSLTFITIRNQKRGNFKYSILVLSDLFLEDLGSRPLEIQDAINELFPKVKERKKRLT